jgi:hypothetical protein
MQRERACTFRRDYWLGYRVKGIVHLLFRYALSAMAEMVCCPRGCVKMFVRGGCVEKVIVAHGNVYELNSMALFLEALRW